jgi:Glycosyl-hydrolase 97 C-terminal, oligomerisation
VGGLNGLTGRRIELPLRFLERGTYQATLVRDQMDEPAAVHVNNVSVAHADRLTFSMRAGGGFVARFQRMK